MGRHAVKNGRRYISSIYKFLKVQATSRCIECEVSSLTRLDVLYGIVIRPTNHYCLSIQNEDDGSNIIGIVTY